MLRFLGCVPLYAHAERTRNPIARIARSLRLQYSPRCCIFTDNERCSSLYELGDLWRARDTANPAHSARTRNTPSSIMSVSSPATLVITTDLERTASRGLRRYACPCLALGAQVVALRRGARYDRELAVNPTSAVGIRPFSWGFQRLGPWRVSERRPLVGFRAEP